MRALVLLAILVMADWSYSETLTIATPPFSPPFVMANNRQHHFYGFSIDIMDEVCKRINATCHYEPFSLNDTFAKVMNGQADLAIGNITITSEREQYVLFSLPYLPSEVQFLTVANSPLTSLENLRGKTVGAEEASIFPEYIKRTFGDSIKVVTYVNITDMMDPLGSSDIDAVILDKPTADYWYANNADVFKLLGPSAELGSGIGIIASKLNTQLIARVNKALIAMEADGVYLKIFNTYFSDELSSK